MFFFNNNPFKQPQHMSWLCQTAFSAFLPLLCFLFISCRTLHPEIPDQSSLPLPDTYSSWDNTANNRETPWWQSFDSQELNHLIQQVLSGNLSLAQSAARLRQARAAAQKTGAMLLPEITVSAAAAQNERHSTDSVSQTTEEYSLGAAASYELDLWGRVRAVRNSARLDADASGLDLHIAVVSLTARTAEVWLKIAQTRELAALIHRQIKTNRQFYEILKKKQISANADLLDVYRQEQVLLASEAQLPLIEQTLEQLRNELLLLLGRPPGEHLELNVNRLPELPPRPQTGMPADLLAMRPDVHKQWLLLQAAGWNVTAARADRLPAIRLTGKFEYNTSDPGSLFDNWLTALAASLSAPLFDGNRRLAETKRTQAALDENLLKYRQVVLAAIGEVENAVVKENRLLEQLLALEKQLASAQTVHREAEHRYRNGAVDFISVLQAIRTRQQLEREIIVLRGEIMINRVALMRALGGVWLEEIFTINDKGKQQI